MKKEYLNFRLVIAVMNTRIADANGKRNHTAKCVLIALAKHANKKRGYQAWISKETIAEYFDLDPRTIPPNLQWLVANSYIRITSKTKDGRPVGGRHNPTRYQINLDKLYPLDLIDGVEDEDEEDSSDAQKGASDALFSTGDRRVNNASDAPFSTLEKHEKDAFHNIKGASDAQKDAFHNIKGASDASEENMEENISKESIEKSIYSSDKPTNVDSISYQREKETHPEPERPSNIIPLRHVAVNAASQAIFSQQLVYPPKEAKGAALVVWQAIRRVLNEAGASDADIMHYARSVTESPHIFGELTGNALLQAHQQARQTEAAGRA